MSVVDSPTAPGPGPTGFGRRSHPFDPRQTSRDPFRTGWTTSERDHPSGRTRTEDSLVLKRPPARPIPALVAV